MATALNEALSELSTINQHIDRLIKKLGFFLESRREIWQQVENHRAAINKLVFSLLVNTWEQDVSGRVLPEEKE